MKKTLAKKGLALLIAVVALVAVMCISAFADTVEVGNYTDFHDAIVNASGERTIKLTADISTDVQQSPAAGSDITITADEPHTITYTKTSSGYTLFRITTSDTHLTISNGITLTQKTPGTYRNVALRINPSLTGSTITLEGNAVVDSFRGSSADTYVSAVHIQSGTFYMTGGTIQNCGCVYYKSDSTEVMHAAIFINDTGNATAYISGGKIINNGNSKAVASGGTAKNKYGRVIWNCGALYISGDVEISGNYATSGGAIYSSGAFEISGNPVIKNNTVQSYGGAIYSTGAKTGTISGGTFSGNKSESGSGGAFYISGGRQLTISSGIFSDNSATAGHGGFIQTEGAATVVNIEGGTFENNTATGSDKLGGAIRVYQGTVNVSGGTFTGNKGTNGGVASVSSAGTLNISGGIFTGNTASNNGAAVNLEADTSKLTLSGNVAFGTQDIYVGSGSITKDGEFTWSGTNAIRFPGAASEGTVVVTGAADGDEAKFSVANENIAGMLPSLVFDDGAVKLHLEEPASKPVKIEGVGEYMNLGEAIAEASDDDVIEITENITETALIETDKQLTIKADEAVTISNGITASVVAGKRAIFTLNSGAELTFVGNITIDCNNTIGGFVVRKGAELTFAGTILKSWSSGTNAPSSLENKEQHGAGIYNNGTVNFAGQILGAYSGNSWGGAVYNYEDGVFNMTAGLISGCRAWTYGGAIANLGELNITGGKIGGINTITTGTTKSDGTYANVVYGSTLINQAGAAIHNEAGATCTLGNVEILGHTGGAIRNNGSLVINEGTKIHDNTAAASGAALMTGDSVTTASYEINGGEFYNNSSTLAGKNGGFLYAGGAETTINGGKFGGNTSVGAGGCIYSYKSVLHINGGYFGAFKASDETEVGLNNASDSVIDCIGYGSNADAGLTISGAPVVQEIYVNKDYPIEKTDELTGNDGDIKIRLATSFEDGALIVSGATDGDQDYFTIANQFADYESAEIEFKEDSLYLKLNPFKYIENTDTGKKYGTFEEALEAAESDETIKILNTISVGEPIDVSKSVIITSDSAEHIVKSTITSATYGKRAVFMVKEGADVAFENITIDGGKGMGGLFIEKDAKATLTDVTIQNCTVTDPVYKHKNEEGEYDGTYLYDEKGTDPRKYGAGIYNDGTLEMTNTIIIGCNCGTQFGGAIYNDKNGEATFNSGAMAGNKAYTGAGAVYNAGTFTMKNGIIGGDGFATAETASTEKGNVITGSSSTQYGSAVYNKDGAIFNFEDGTISGNIAIEKSGKSGFEERGAFVNYGTLNMSGEAKIENNIFRHSDNTQVEANLENNGTLTIKGENVTVGIFYVPTKAIELAADSSFATVTEATELTTVTCDNNGDLNAVVTNDKAYWDDVIEITITSVGVGEWNIPATLTYKAPRIEGMKYNLPYQSHIFKEFTDREESVDNFFIGFAEYWKEGDSDKPTEKNPGDLKALWDDDAGAFEAEDIDGKELTVGWAKIETMKGASFRITSDENSDYSGIRFVTTVERFVFDAMKVPFITESEWIETDKIGVMLGVSLTKDYGKDDGKEPPTSIAVTHSFNMTGYHWRGDLYFDNLPEGTHAYTIGLNLTEDQYVYEFTPQAFMKLRFSNMVAKKDADGDILNTDGEKYKGEAAEEISYINYTETKKADIPKDPDDEEKVLVRSARYVARAFAKMCNENPALMEELTYGGAPGIPDQRAAVAKVAYMDYINGQFKDKDN